MAGQFTFNRPMVGQYYVIFYMHYKKLNQRRAQLINQRTLVLLFIMSIMHGSGGDLTASVIYPSHP